MDEQKPVARLVIQGPGAMDARQRRRLLKWLKTITEEFEQDPKAYTHGKFTARLFEGA